VANKDLVQLPLDPHNSCW